MSQESTVQFFSLIITCLIAISTHLHGYRDGARENSCYNHTIDHGADSFLLDCVPSSCRYFLIIKEVVNENTLELGNETDTFECGRIYGSENILLVVIIDYCQLGNLMISVEVANSLNPPEGFLVQARNGTEDSSEIIGTFLDPSVVSARRPNIPVNYKILQCRSHQDSDIGPLDVSINLIGYALYIIPSTSTNTLFSLYVRDS